MPINSHNPFKGRQYPGEVIVLCVRWYLRYPLSYEQVTELVAERGVEVDARLHLALGAGVCTRAQQTLPTAPQADEQELSDRRDLHQRKRHGQVSVSSAGFHRADDRISTHGQTRYRRSQALPPQSD